LFINLMEGKVMRTLTDAGSVFDNGDEVIRWSKDPNTWINRYGRSWRDTILNNYYETGELME